MPRIEDAVELSGPKVAARPDDRWVVQVAQGILVVTGEGRVFGHRLSDAQVMEAVELPAPRTAANPVDRWVDRDGRFIAVITSEGRVFAHGLHLPDGSVFADVFPDRVESAREVPGSKVAANPGEKWLFVDGGRIIVITDDGRTFAHPLHFNGANVPDRVEAAHQLAGPKVAANPQDKWVLTSDSRIFVITTDGSVFMHKLSANEVSPATRLEGPPVAAQSVDRWLLATNSPDVPSRLIVITSEGRVFAHALRPTRAEMPH